MPGILTSTEISKIFKKLLDISEKVRIIMNVPAIEDLCNGSTPDSDSVCGGSNPSSSAKINTRYSSECLVFLFIFVALEVIMLEKG